jgi:hypothetical protein
MVEALLENVGFLAEAQSPSTSHFERQERNLLTYSMVVHLREKVVCENPITFDIYPNGCCVSLVYLEMTEIAKGSSVSGHVPPYQ